MAKTKSKARGLARSEAHAPRAHKKAGAARRRELRPAGSRSPGRRAEIGRAAPSPRLAPPRGLEEARRSSVERPASYEERRASVERPVPELAPEMEEYEEGGYPRRFSAPKAMGYEEDADLGAEALPEEERRWQEGRRTSEPGAEEPVGPEEPLARRRRQSEARAQELSRRGARTLAVPVGRGRGEHAPARSEARAPRADAEAARGTARSEARGPRAARPRKGRSGGRGR